MITQSVFKLSQLLERDMFCISQKCCHCLLTLSCRVDQISDAKQDLCSSRSSELTTHDTPTNYYLFKKDFEARRSKFKQVTVG